MKYQILRLHLDGCRAMVIAAEGQFYIDETKGYSIGDMVLAKYNPADQFASIVPMDQVIQMLEPAKAKFLTDDILDRAKRQTDQGLRVFFTPVEITQMMQGLDSLMVNEVRESLSIAYEDPDRWKA